MDVDAIVQHLRLQPHPEGGFYRETFRAALDLQLPHGTRQASTAIYFLLPAGVFSAWHRVQSDELWHFYEGDPVTLHLLDEAGPRQVVLGPLSGGHQPQAVVPAGTWQAAAADGPSWGLCGCTVAPGFDFSDFEMPGAADLRALFPAHGALVDRFTRR